MRSICPLITFDDPALLGDVMTVAAPTSSLPRRDRGPLPRRADRSSRWAELTRAGFARAPLTRALLVSGLAAALAAASACEPRNGGGGCDDCAGCCRDGACLAGIADDACGVFGGKCQTCDAGRTCQAGSCVSGGTSCGCREASGACQPGSSASACGATGGTCLTCPPGESCVGGLCLGGCSYANCAGCCANGRCVTAIGATACGAAGGTCQSCAAGKACVLGECVAQGGGCAACSGCCYQGTSCLPGSADSACGRGGAVCDSCAIGSSCSAGSCVPTGLSCSAASCPGCCDRSGRCVALASQGATSCGRGGEPCQSCPGPSCAAGVCAFGNEDCLRACTQGCCDQAGRCVALAVQSASACGQFGLCSGCGAGAACVQGVCSGNASWSVGVRSLTVASRRPDGRPWDPIGDGAPDLYLRASLLGTLRAGLIWPPPTYDSFAPTFAGSILLSATEEDLTTHDLQLDVLDADAFVATVFDDSAGQCTLRITAGMLQARSHLIPYCGSATTDLLLTFTPQ